jgi:hypothetical protein
MQELKDTNIDHFHPENYPVQFEPLFSDSKSVLPLYGMCSGIDYVNRGWKPLSLTVENQIWRALEDAFQVLDMTSEEMEAWRSSVYTSCSSKWQS